MHTHNTLLVFFLKKKCRESDINSIILISPPFFHFSRFFLQVPDTVLEERICNRRTDPHTGIIYNLVTKPPPSHDVDVINRLEQRKDDTKEALSTRLVEYVCQ
jgi:hypothetical protein